MYHAHYVYTSIDSRNNLHLSWAQILISKKETIIDSIESGENTYLQVKCLFCWNFSKSFAINHHPSFFLLYYLYSSIHYHIFANGSCDTPNNFYRNHSKNIMLFSFLLYCCWCCQKIELYCFCRTSQRYECFIRLVPNSKWKLHNANFLLLHFFFRSLFGGCVNVCSSLKSVKCSAKRNIQTQSQMEEVYFLIYEYMP